MAITSTEQNGPVSGEGVILATTDDATVYTVKTIKDFDADEIPEGAILRYTVKIIGSSSTGAQHAYIEEEGVVSRQTAGNVNSDYINSSIGAFDCVGPTIDINVGDQAVHIQVAGKAATTMKWCVYYKFKILMP